MTEIMVQALFWVFLFLILYTYVGYAVLLKFLRRQEVMSDQAFQAPVSVILAVHNEEANLERKMASLFALDYPASAIEFVVVSDGSTDRTNAILAHFPEKVTAVLLPHAEGKANALNHGVKASRGDVLVFMDARQSVDPDAVRQLVSYFADPQVGAVSGELHLETADGRPSSEALGVYWKLEKLVRKLESATGSVVGATGALFAMRRELYLPLPGGTLLDDVLTPMQVVRAGKRVLFCETAIARDRLFAAPGKEFGRKVRTLTGNYQLLQLAPWLLSFRNPLLFRLISHKLLRLAVPLFLVGLLIASAASSGWVYRWALTLQLLLYALALLGALAPGFRRWRAVSIAYTFVMLNVAATLAFYNFLRGRAQWV